MNGPVRMWKRGAGAWDNAPARDFVGATERGENPLMIHAVQDKGNLGNYLPAARGLIAWGRKHGARFTSQEEKDNTAADYMAYQAYQQNRDVSLGKKILSALLHLYPHWKGSMGNAARALHGGGTQKVVEETEPWAEEMVTLMIALALLAGHIWVSLALTDHFGMGWREQDLEQLLGEDILDSRDNVGFVFGVPARGEQAKSGVDQGAVCRRPWVARMNRVAKQLVPAKEKVFKLSMNFYRGQIETLTSATGGPEMKTRKAHKARHSAAAIMVEQGDPLEEVRRACRWAHEKSGAIYTKRHLLLRARAKLPPETLNAGRWLIDHGDMLADHWIERVVEESRQRPNSFRSTRGREATVDERRNLLHWEEGGAGSVPGSS